MTAEEKKARGKELRALVSSLKPILITVIFLIFQSCVATGPSRSREPRIDTVFKDGLEKLATGVDKYNSSVSLEYL